MNDNFRFYVYTRHQLGISPHDIHNELLTVHGDACPSDRTVCRWISDIKTDHFQLTKRSGPGRPVSTTTAANVQKIKTLIAENSRLSCSDIASTLSIPKTCVYEILTKTLNLRNVYAVWVPHDLSESNKSARITCCKELIKLFNDRGFQYMCSNYVIEDESWFVWDQTGKRRVWIERRAVKPTNVKSKLTKRKTMGLVAFTCKPKRFSVSILPRGVTIDAEYMIQYIKDTGKRFQNLKHNSIALKDTHLQMDNARPHSAVATQDYLRSRNVPLVHQSPYSPDLNLCDRFLFRAVKVDLNTETLGDPEDVKSAIQRSIRLISENTLVDQLRKLRDHCDRVVEANGNYISQID